MTSPLFTSVHIGGREAPHRVVMAPMTRARSSEPGDVPNAMNARYYAQRASAALIVSEATQVSPQGKGYSFTPGIYSPEQMAGWRLVTQAVHAEGGRIFAQLWHVGRMSHPDFHSGEPSVAPSAVAFEGKIWKVDPATGRGEMVNCPTPRALGVDEIRGIVADFRRAARNAIDAGFDGVEIHGANGYLIDQFLRTTSNVRTDEYGGPRKNRLRFLEELISEVTTEIGADRTAIRLAPFLTARGMACPDILPTILEAVEFLQAHQVAYVHLVEADWDDAPQFTEEFRKEVRARFSGSIIVAGKYDIERANWVLERGYADLVAFGRPFIANPDLPARLAQRLPIANFDPATLWRPRSRLHRLPTHATGRLRESEMFTYKGSTALITGASKGLGVTFAEELARRGADLVLIARSKDALQTLAARLTAQYGVKCYVIAADLADPRTIDDIYAELTEHGLPVDLLINNAGLGLTGGFLDHDHSKELASIQVNVQALVGLSHRFGKAMSSRGQGGIINIASNSAFQPLPYMATYAASKAFVLHFGEALQRELSPTGVRVTTACPGPTATSFFDGTPTTMSDRSFDTPEMVVRGILGAFDQGKAVVYPGRSSVRIATWLPRFLPRAVVVRLAAMATGKMGLALPKADPLFAAADVGGSAA